MTCGKDSYKDKIINYFFKKITKKFNIFYYLKQIKTLKIIKNSTLKNEQIKLITLVSSKQYNVKMNEENKKTLSQEEKNSKILNYFVDAYNPEKDTPEQKILNYFIEDN